MKILAQAAVAAGLLALGACTNTPAENAAQNVEMNAENTADVLDEQADNAATEAGEAALDNQAAAVRAEGENTADAIEANERIAIGTALPEPAQKSLTP